MVVNKVSVISLTYKNWGLLDVAIDSINKQVIPNSVSIEYFIVDDGTEDFDEKYVLSKLEDFKFEYHIIRNKKNIGTVKSFNNVIKKATGDIIIPLSADDEFYDNNVLIDIINEFERSNSLLITGIRVPIVNGTEMSGLPEKSKRKFFNDNRVLLKNLVLFGNFISGASTYYNKKVFDIFGFFDEEYRLLEDYPFYLRVLEKGDFKINFFERKVIKYGMEGISSSNKDINPYLKKDYIKVSEYKFSLKKISQGDIRYIKWLKIKNKYIRVFAILYYPDSFVKWFFRIVNIRFKLFLFP